MAAHIRLSSGAPDRPPAILHVTEADGDREEQRLQCAAARVLGVHRQLSVATGQVSAARELADSSSRCTPLPPLLAAGRCRRRRCRHCSPTGGPPLPAGFS